MEADYKKTLLNIAYYGTAILTIALAICFMVGMSLRGVAMYQQVIYYIWAILLILTIVFDIISTHNGTMKFIIGLIVVGLTFLCILVGIINYAGMSVDGVIPYFAMGNFALIIGFSVVLTILTIVVFCVGEKITNLRVERRAK